MATIGGAAASNTNPNKSIEQSYEIQKVQRNGDDWPKDVVMDILSRLPVKSLMRFKCLQKSVCVVIQSPEFVSQHLNNYYNNSRNSSLLAFCYLNKPDFSGNLLMFSPNQTSQYQPFDLPLDDLCLGPCNGIFLLCNYTECSLWNPATKQLITLPPYPNPELPSHIEYGFPTCGFGLNPTTNDFEVVAIRPVHEVEGFRFYPSRVMVYTSSSNSWRDLGNPLQDDEWNYKINGGSDGYTCVQGQGIYYWLVRRGKYILISFDMGSDSFELFQMPVWWDQKSHNIKAAITIYHDSLALLLCDKDKGCMDVWVMNDRNWIKQLSVSSPVAVGLLSLFGIWINDWFVIRTKNEPLVIWNAITGEVKHLSLHSSVDDNYIEHCMGFLTYRESLFSINIGGDNN